MASEKKEPLPDPPALLIHDGVTFYLSKKIGEGGFARCYEVTEQESRRKFAIKAIHVAAMNKQKVKSKLLNEISIHSRLDHRYIVKLYRIFKDTEYIYLVLELCENKTLVELLRSRKILTEPETRHLLWQILSAVNYLHEQAVIHRDLKLGNIFLNLENDVKVGDFGLATTLDQAGDRKKTLCGTPNYIAPEILFNKARGHSFEVDVWAIGVIMYTLLFGRPPFQGGDVKSIYDNIERNNYVFPSHIAVSDTAKQLITTILNHDPDKRPKIASIAEHAFFRYVIIKDPSHLEIAAIRQECARLSMKEPPVRRDSTVAKENVPPVARASLPRDTKRTSIVDAVYHNLCLHLDGRARASEPMPEPIPPAVYLERYLDYTDKYGLGYLCANGNIGAYFNDSTSLILNPTTRAFEYYFQDTSATGRHILRTRHRLEDVPTELVKKVTIIKYFQSHLVRHTAPSVTVGGEAAMDIVTKYAKIRDAVLCRISNRVIQVFFSERSSLVLSQEGLVVSVLEGETLISTTLLAHLVKDPLQSALLLRLRQLRSMLESVLHASTGLPLDERC